MTAADIGHGITVEPFTGGLGTCADELCPRDPAWRIVHMIVEPDGNTVDDRDLCSWHAAAAVTALMQSIRPADPMPGLADRTSSVNILRDDDGGPHLRLRVFVGRTPGSRAYAGDLTVRREEEPVTRDALEGEHRVEWGARRRDGVIHAMGSREAAAFITSGDGARDYPDVVRRTIIVGPWRTDGL